MQIRFFGCKIGRMQYDIGVKVCVYPKEVTMSIQTSKDEYIRAQHMGQREIKELQAAGKPVDPLVLDEILPDTSSYSVQEVGLVEIPSERIVGTKSAGRISAFTPTFLPLLSPESEFGCKWINLCEAHLGDVGIREPILCFEYLGNFYVQEGNKRVSVLRYFGSPRIPSNVRRIVPPMSEDPRIVAYYEFLDFYKDTRLYAIQFRRPGDYAKLLAFLHKKPGEAWTQQERRNFNAYFQYFREAFFSLGYAKQDILPEEALLLWLKLYPYEDLGRKSGMELRKTLSALWSDVVTTTQNSVKVQTKAESGSKSSLLTKIMSTGFSALNVAFVHQLSPSTSSWTLGHEEGRKYLQSVMGDKIVTRSYFDAKNSELAEEKIEQAVADGAQVVFTTAPLLAHATLKMAVKYPKVNFLNCSVDQSYSSVRTYYGRIYEGKFITGAIAGALAQNDRIGYIASYPIFGVPASINAFALGAQLTNPRAQIDLRWSCKEGSPQSDFFADGIRVISTKDIPTDSRVYLDFCSYGTYLMDSMGELLPLASPVWVWGKFYEFVVRSMFSGSWKNEQAPSTALNYWLGIDSGVINVNLSDRLPEGVRKLAKLLIRSFADRSIDPFFRRIVAQDGSVKNDGSKTFTPDQILHMDWLCDNVIGSIPSFDELIPMAQPVVRELGIYRDKLPPVKEVTAHEDPDSRR